MEIINANDKEFDCYVLNSPKPHYLQTSAWGEVNRKRGLIPHLLELKDKDRVVGSAMLIEKKILNYSTFYCPRGFVCDYSNKEDIKNMTHYLKEYVKKHNGLYLKIDPDIIIRKLDANANVKETFNEKIELIEYIKSLGGKHRGYTVRFSQSSLPRFTFRVDITKDNLVDTFHQTTKKIIKRNNPYGLKITINKENDIDNFYKIIKDTAVRKKLYIEDKSFYESFYYTLHSKNMSDLYTISVDVEKLKKQITDSIDNITSEMNSLKGSNKSGKLKDLQEKLTKFNKEYDEIKTINEKEIFLSSIITAKYKDYVWTIHGGNANELSFLNANYELYWNIIQDAKKQGYKIVDFYGSEGIIDKSSSSYGIFNFKVRFGGDFDEFIGEFDFVTKPFINSIITFLLKVRRKIKYRFQKRH